MNMHRFVRLLVASVAMVIAPRAWSQPLTMPTEAPLQVGVQLVQAEIASTPAERERGLMFRRELTGNHGMLFVFPTSQPVCMWMKNTLIPLSVAFIDNHGAIVNIAEMQAQTETPHCAARPVQFALEMPQGWFASRGIGPGLVLRGTPFGTPPHL